MCFFLNTVYDFIQVIYRIAVSTSRHCHTTSFLPYRAMTALLDHSPRVFVEIIKAGFGDKNMGSCTKAISQSR